MLRSHRWRTVANSAAYLTPHLRPGVSVLDVGCGPGTITADIARLVAPGRVVGFDRSADVVAAATADHAGIENVDFRQGDVYAIGERDDSFDVVHAHQVLQHLSDPVAALSEMGRVCRLGGVVAARDADYEAFTLAPADGRLDRWLDLYRRVARANGAEPDAGRHLLGWAKAAGFTQVEASASVWCFATDEDRTWWGTTWAERCRSSAFAQQARNGGLADAGELEEMALAFEQWASRDDGWFAVLHGEILATA